MNRTHNSGPLTTYRAFWPYYLREHARAPTRAIHIGGTLCGGAALTAGLVLGQPWWIAGALVLGYGPAWFAHFFVEKNRPATFTYPLWSLASDVRMCGLWLAGRLSDELARAGIGKR